MARLLSSETRRRLGEHDRRWPIKFGMRAVAIPLAFIIMILFAVTTNMSKQNYGGNDWTDGMPLAPVLLSLFYNPVVLFLSLFHRHSRPIHPGWDVGVDLLVWALALPAIVFSVGDGWFWYWQPVLIDFEGLVPCDDWNFWSEQCSPLIYTLGRMEIAANVFLALLLIIHFTLFVFACIATHRLRKENKHASIENRNSRELQYHRSPEEHKAQEPPAYTPSAEGSIRTPVSHEEEENPFKDPNHTAAPNEHENPFNDVNHSAIKYA